MSELDSYRHKRVFLIDDNTVDQIVHRSTQHAIMHSRKQHTTPLALTRWVAAAVVALVAGAIWLSNDAPIPRVETETKDVIAYHAQAPDIQSEGKTVESMSQSAASFKDNSEVNKCSTPTTTDKPKPTAAGEWDDIDTLLSQMTDDELQTLDDEYFIDEIPEY